MKEESKTLSDEMENKFTEWFGIEPDKTTDEWLEWDAAREGFLVGIEAAEEKFSKDRGKSWDEGFKACAAVFKEKYSGVVEAGKLPEGTEKKLNQLYDNHKKARPSLHPDELAEFELGLERGAEAGLEASEERYSELVETVRDTVEYYDSAQFCSYNCDLEVGHHEPECRAQEDLREALRAIEENK